MKLPEIIQGGMGVAISDWHLANAVSSQGQLGVISGTGIHLILIGRLTEGDPGGHVRRALSHFPFQNAVQWVLDKYFNPDPDKRAAGHAINVPQCGQSTRPKNSTN